MVAHRSGELQIDNFMRPSARLLICATWPLEAHQFDTYVLKDLGFVEIAILCNAGTKSLTVFNW